MTAHIIVRLVFFFAVLTPTHAPSASSNGGDQHADHTSAPQASIAGLLANLEAGMCLFLSFVAHHSYSFCKQILS